jgi:glycosyltransferase involved in cell wall biosynthesis
MKRKVYIIYKVFNHYRKPVFDKLNEKFDLNVLHSLNDEWVKSEKASYSRIVKSFKYGKKPTEIWLFIESILIRKKPEVIIHEFTPSLISLYTSYLISRLLNIKFIVWGHGYNRQVGFQKRNLSNIIRLFFMKISDAILVYGQEGKKELSDYIKQSKIFVAQNTLDTNELSRICNSLELSGVEKVKSELKINNKYNLLFIGRLIPDKKPEILLSINQFLLERKLDVAIHYFGSGESENVLKKEVLEKKYTNVFFHGEVYDDKITGKFLYAADLMVMPGYLGLSINHAFCFNCPVVSYQQESWGPFHSPEIEYIIQNKTGYLADQKKEYDLENWIMNYLQNESLQKMMQDEIKRFVKEIFPLSKMVNGISDSIEYVLEKKNGV